MSARCNEDEDDIGTNGFMTSSGTNGFAATSTIGDSEADKGKNFFSGIGFGKSFSSPVRIPLLIYREETWRT